MRGRDECPSSEGRTQPRCIVPIFHRVYGVGGLLKNHLACCDCRDRWEGEPISVNVHHDALWKALEMKTRSPEKFTDVSEVVVLTRMVFLSNSMMINATNTVVLERIWINRVAGNLCFSLLIHTGQRDLVSAFTSRHWLSLHDPLILPVK